jgi:hypothetical protein
MTMRFLPAVLTVAFLAVKFSTAQSDPDIPTPRSFGLGAGVKIRDILENTGYTRSSLRHDRRAHLDTRQQGGTDGRCGPDGDGASCADGFCCSDSVSVSLAFEGHWGLKAIKGWCGNTSEMCAAPQCQIDFGPGCDAHKVPSGDSTREIPRPHLGDIPYGGEGVRSCVEPGTLAITYDDGPYIYTNDILDQFASYGMRATFFITGNNLGKGAIDDSSTPWPAVIRRMTSEGHQVASHTWSHQDLSVITPQQRLNELIYNEMAFRNVIGAFPTYMRPPYLSCSEACQQDLSDLGYVIVYPDLDTNGMHSSFHLASESNVQLLIPTRLALRFTGADPDG